MKKYGPECIREDSASHRFYSNDVFQCLDSGYGILHELSTIKRRAGIKRRDLRVLVCCRNNHFSDPEKKGRSANH